MLAHPPVPTRVAAVLLAAGASTRLGRAKQLLRDETGTPLVVRVTTQLLASGCDPVVVVTGAECGPVSDALAGFVVTVVHNADYAEGMGSSIRCGVWAISVVTGVRPIDGVLISACDMPQIDRSHYERLLLTSENGRLRTGTTYVSEKCSLTEPMMLGIPAIFPVSDLIRLSQLSGDRGARALLAEGARPVETLGTIDIDTEKDVREWRASMS